MKKTLKELQARMKATKKAGGKPHRDINWGKAGKVVGWDTRIDCECVFEEHCNVGKVEYLERWMCRAPAGEFFFLDLALEVSP